MNDIKRSSCWITVAVVTAALSGFGCTAGESAKSTQTNSASAPAGTAIEISNLGVPSSLVVEHKEIHEMLEEVTTLGGKTGEAAKTVEEKLSEHFKKEEEFAMPQLGLLRELADGKAVKSPRAIEFSDKLKADLPKMLAEHKELAAALELLAEAAKSENKPLGVKFAEKLKAHAKYEEEILYPAAILVGRILRSAPQG